MTIRAGETTSMRRAAPPGDQVRATASSGMDRPAWMFDDGRPLTGAGVRIAVVDSGWWRGLSDARVLPGAGIANDATGGLIWTSDDSDRVMHGTRCGRIALEIATEANLLPLRVFEATLETSPAAIESAIDRAIAAGARVINLSLGARHQNGAEALYRACERARLARVVVVAASQPDGHMVPAAFDNVLSVGSHWFPTPFHHAYRRDALVECVASGQTHTMSDPAAPRRAGPPSFAAPRIAGIVALLLERWPALDLDGVREKLAELGTPVDRPAPVSNR